MSFHEVQFPTGISYGSAGGPEFKTEIVELASAHERRNQLWTYPRERWDVAFGIKAEAQLQSVIEFFYARRGRLYGFRFKNHDDYQGVAEDIGDGDGSTVAFQLVRNYTSGGETHQRKISKPVDDGNLSVFIDTVEVAESLYAVDYTTGIVTLDAAPVSGENVTATFEFDVPVRFDTDFLPVNLETLNARGATIPIVEIRV